MKLNNLKTKNRIKKPTRVGRGIAAGQGKTCGRGTKGQKSRAGYNLPRHFEGGQTPLIRRLPKKKGFRSRQIKPVIVNLQAIDSKFSTGEKVTRRTLFEKGLIKSPSTKVKILGNGKLSKKLHFSGLIFSESVSQIINPKTK